MTAIDPHFALFLKRWRKSNLDWFQFRKWNDPHSCRSKTKEKKTFLTRPKEWKLRPKRLFLLTNDDWTREIENRARKNIRILSASLNECQAKQKTKLPEYLIKKTASRRSTTRYLCFHIHIDVLIERCVRRETAVGCRIELRRLERQL